LNVPSVSASSTTATRCACSRGATTASMSSASICGWPRTLLARHAGTRSSTTVAQARQRPRWWQGKRC
ncbi:hypothetical protein BAE44_0003826, partial [Dichanthelium oligosanthes]